MNVVSLIKYVSNHPLNRNDKAKSVSRLVRWQIASRIFPGKFAIPFVNDTRLLVARGMTGATGNYYCGLHEVFEMGFVLHFLRPGDLLGDIGANVGSYTVMAAGAVGADVVTVEPVPTTFANLQDNIRLNRLEDRVVAHCCGVSSRAGEARFVSEHDTTNRIALPEETQATIVVPLRTLDELFAGRHANLLKIDVEGHEAAVLEGGKAVLADPALLAVLMETNGSGAKFGLSDDGLIATMRDAGFEPYGYDPFRRQLIPPGVAQANTIFVRDVAAVSARCAAAPRFSLINGSI